MARVAGRFARVEPRRRARAFVLGLLADLPRKNCWTIAEHAGDASPAGMQHLLSRASWDADHVRDDIRDFVVDHLADEGAVLVVDETGDLKKGTASVGVQRQYTGTAGRIENSQVAVYLVYSSPAGHAAIDRRLYIPRSWTQDPDRCRAAGVPEGLGFATKPALATEMIAQALDADVPAAWVTGDEVYGGDPHLSAELERRQIGYVLAVSRKRPITTCAGVFRAGVLAHGLPKNAWQRLSAGAGAKGHRFYDWAQVDIDSPQDSGGHWWLLIRRNRRTGAFYRCYSAHPVPLTTLVKVAGRRWTVEETFQAAKGLAGLDEHQVRRWTSWHRWTTLAMLAHAFLAVTAAIEQAATRPPGFVPLTCSEIRRLFAAFITPPIRNLAHRLRWSDWRRRHQARARTSHYRRQAAQQP
ncbi:IS701 family transposase [Kitasatospora aureofaciens]|nr:IS701 family transposase [Kitasatospora aureofaciens]ARF81950.1 DDE transposase [Kitasatospora aureofaciens]QEV03451.1 IS701 family transposase [Streptomyces viridifaciens]UKZ03666.1 IS701 family transposase [Streptomyces viridifaciens]